MISIIKNIKSVCKTKAVSPLLTVIAMVFILIICPFFQIFHPEKTDGIFNVTKKQRYVNVTADTLYYSGYNLIQKGDGNYGYYYGLKDNKCIFVILPIEGTPKNQLHHYTFKAKVIRPNRSFEKMLLAFAKDLNWNETSLKKVSGDFVISNADYHPMKYMLFLWIVLVVLLISAKKLLSSIIGYMNPYLYPVCTFLGKEEQKFLIQDAGRELNSQNYLQINSMFITENYFIDLGKNKVCIIPLVKIVWCYRVGEFSLKAKSNTPVYNLCFTLFDGSTIMAKHKTSDEALELINAIRATEYDIIIGHSDSKRKQAKRRIVK